MRIFILNPRFDHLCALCLLFWVTNEQLMLRFARTVPTHSSKGSNAVYVNETNQANFAKRARHPSRHPLLLAIYFPQFHQDSLNDKLWGEGFTDWNNLRKAPSHNRQGDPIPRPSELGFYNLLDPDVRRKQGELARQYGIDGFVIHHYWFYDDAYPGPTLAAPLEKMIEDGYPDIPFCLNWCASKWVNTWHGVSNYTKNDVLQLQHFPDDPMDDRVTAHYQWLRQLFHHPNYIKVNGQPVFFLYQKKPKAMPILKRLRELATADGFPGLYLELGKQDPHRVLWPAAQDLRKPRWPRDVFNRTVSYPQPYDGLKAYKIPYNCERHGDDGQQERTTPGLLLAFDNTPRRSLEDAKLWNVGSAVAVHNFRQGLTAALFYQTCCPQMDEDGLQRFVLVNAWNEWAEGMSFEPSDVYGRQFLEVARDVKAIFEGSTAEACAAITDGADQSSPIKANS